MKDILKWILSIIGGIVAVLVIIAGSAAFAVIGSLLGVAAIVCLCVLVLAYGIHDMFTNKKAKPPEDDTTATEHTSM